MDMSEMMGMDMSQMMNPMMMMMMQGMAEGMAMGKGSGKGSGKGKGAEMDMSEMMGMMPMMPMMMMGKGFDNKGGSKGMGKGEFNIKQVVDMFKESGFCPGGAKWANDEKTVFLTGLPPDTTDLDVYKLCAPFGAIAFNGATALKDKDDKEGKKCRGIAVVNFLEVESAENCIAVWNGALMPDGITILKVEAYEAERAAGSGKRKWEEVPGFDQDGKKVGSAKKVKGKGKSPGKTQLW